MDQRHGLDVPQSLSEVCRPEQLGLLIYDMQAGILEQIADRQRVIQNVGEVLEAARGAGIVPIVRVPQAEYAWVARVLDNGAQGSSCRA